MFRFKCKTCDEWHEEIPVWGADCPVYYFGIPETEREERCWLTEDLCAIDESHFFARGCLELPITDSPEVLSFSIWISLSEKSFIEFASLLNAPQHSDRNPYFGWLSNPIATYPDTLNIKTNVHLRDNYLQPYIELEPTNHPLAVEQREGVSLDRIQKLWDAYIHQSDR